MGERYFITGAQLGIVNSYLEGNLDVLSLKKLVDNVNENQFIGNVTITDNEPFVSVFPINIRPELIWFIVEMEKVLKQNDHKQHWSKCDFKYLFKRLCEELDELAESIYLGKDPVIISKESTDVANISMMIADNLRRMK